MKRRNGYYVCQIDYDMTREIVWWDGAGFFVAGNEVAYIESDFIFIAETPIDLGSEQWCMLPVAPEPEE